MLRFGQGLYIEQCPERKQRIDGNFGTVCFAKTIADYWIEHPTRYCQARLFVDLYDERFIMLVLLLTLFHQIFSKYSALNLPVCGTVALLRRDAAKCSVVVS